MSCATHRGLCVKIFSEALVFIFRKHLSHFFDCIEKNVCHQFQRSYQLSLYGIIIIAMHTRACVFYEIHANAARYMPRVVMLIWEKLR